MHRPGHGWRDERDSHTGRIEADLPEVHGLGLKISLEYPVELVTEPFGWRPVEAVHQIRHVLGAQVEYETIDDGAIGPLAAIPQV